MVVKTAGGQMVKDRRMKDRQVEDRWVEGNTNVGHEAERRCCRRLQGEKEKTCEEEVMVEVQCCPCR